MLKPVVAFFEGKLHHRIGAILLSYLVAVLPLLAVLFFFYNQSRILFSQLPPVREKLRSVASQLMDWLNRQLNLDPQSSANWISENFVSAVDLPIGLVQESFQSGAMVLANIVLIVLITYFMLLYRTAFKNFFLSQLHPKYRDTTHQLFDHLQRLANRFLVGQGLVVIILGILIGSGLWLIGVPYPFFWGFLAGFLEIIPYVGTTVGVILPFTYMLMVSDTLWQPWAVVFLYIIIQQIEGNFISPNIMGASIKVNPLFIITGLFLGGYLWGVAGMILVLPVLAISKEVFRSFEVLAPISYLMEDRLSRKDWIFLGEFDSYKYRFFSLFFEQEKDEGP